MGSANADPLVLDTHAVVLDVGQVGAPDLDRADRREFGVDCGLVACGLLVWQLTDFAYADIGGPSTVLAAVSLGMVAWWALAGNGKAQAAPAVPVRANAPEGVTRCP